MNNYSQNYVLRKWVYLILLFNFYEKSLQTTIYLTALIQEILKNLPNIIDALKKILLSYRYRIDLFLKMFKNLFFFPAISYAPYKE